jgi:hypothetical protein
MSPNTAEAIQAATPDHPASAVITLETPILRGEQKIEKVALRKPVAGELRGIALADLMKLDVAALHVLLPRITAPTLTQQDVTQMDLVDLVAIGSEIVGFFFSKADRALLSPSA